VRNEARQAKAATRSTSEPMISKAQPMEVRDWNSLRIEVVSLDGASPLRTARADLRSWMSVSAWLYV
jgi:hypothetical protein